jgi:hypothetical protein
MADIGGPSIYAVPAGYTAILHNMTLWVGADGPAEFAGVINVALDQSNIYVWHIAGPPVLAGIYQWEGREVFTGFLEVNAFLGSYSFRASGYLLVDA